MQQYKHTYNIHYVLLIKINYASIIVCHDCTTHFMLPRMYFTDMLCSISTKDVTFSRTVVAPSLCLPFITSLTVDPFQPS
jgi:hypothetical protein